MTLVVTEAIVLHAFDYLESSRILKLVTRDAGVRSVLARGAKRSRKRFGTALDLYAEGTAELRMKTGRDLDTLSSFDVPRAGRSARVARTSRARDERCRRRLVRRCAIGSAVSRIRSPERTTCAHISGCCASSFANTSTTAGRFARSTCGSATHGRRRRG